MKESVIDIDIFKKFMYTWWEIIINTNNFNPRIKIVLSWIL
jgi:hypothetical protein